MVRAWALGALKILPFAIAIAVPRVLFAARQDNGAMIVVPCMLGGAAVFAILAYRARRRTRLQQARSWTRAAGVLAAVTLVAAIGYFVAFQRWTFTYQLEDGARYVAGSEYTEAARTVLAANPGYRTTDVVGDLGGADELAMVWDAGSIEQHRTLLALLFSLLALSLCGTGFAALELSGLDEPRALRFPAAVPKPLAAQRAARQFDVFLCHNSHDKEAVKAIALRLIEAGVLPWLDEWELRPGTRWGPAIDAELRTVRSAAVFVGPNGSGPWQNEEMWALLDRSARQGVPVIPVLLVEQAPPELPVFLAGRTWVQMAKADPDPLQQLLWGIRGRAG